MSMLLLYYYYDIHLTVLDNVVHMLSATVITLNFLIYELEISQIQ